MLLDYVICLFGIILAFQDFKSQHVSLIALTGFFVLCSIFGVINKNFAIYPILVFISIEGIYYFFRKKHAFGLADFIVVLAVSFLFSDEQSPIFIMSCGVFGALLSNLLHKKKFPFIPAILLSTYASKLMQ
ncbi:MAG: hypothetical protein IJS10_03660 [Alphaproteobacteria bacterium]|nr:hypothetical protein [Alphaproteobacteria bacterium]